MFSRRSMPRLSPTSAAGPSPSRPAGARYPNFDFIRLVAASSVIFSRAFQISEGTDENEPLVHLLGALRSAAPILTSLSTDSPCNFSDGGGVNRRVYTGRTISPAHARARSRPPTAQRRGVQDIGSDGERTRSSLDRGGRMLGSGAGRAHRAATP
jgi:hypothetical protein